MRARCYVQRAYISQHPKHSFSSKKLERISTQYTVIWCFQNFFKRITVSREIQYVSENLPAFDAKICS